MNQTESLKKIAGILGVEIKSAKKRFDNRWLSELQIISQFFDELMPLTFFYSSFFISDKEYKKACKFIKRLFVQLHVSPLGQQSITRIITHTREKYLKTARAKASTKKVSRREHILDELFRQRNSFLLLASFQSDLLGILNEYVKFMQLEVPLIHIQMEKMKKLVRTFCSTFIKPNKMNFLSSDVVQDTHSHISHHKLFDGNSYKSKFDQEDLAEFGKLVLPSLVATATHLIDKLPFTNGILKSSVGLDPKFRQKEKTVDKLKELNQLISIENLVKTDVEKDIRKYCCCAESQLPIFKDVSIDAYWNDVEEFPHLCQLAKVVLTCFSGPKIEGVFSNMNMVSTDYRSSLSVPALSACLSAHYRAKVYGTSLSFFPDNPVETPVDPKLVVSIRTAWKQRKAKKQSARDAVAQNVQLLDEGMQLLLEKRKKLNRERRERLSKLIPVLENRRRSLANLPKISRKRLIISAFNHFARYSSSEFYSILTNLFIDRWLKRWMTPAIWNLWHLLNLHLYPKNRNCSQIFCSFFQNNDPVILMLCSSVLSVQCNLSKTMTLLY